MSRSSVPGKIAYGGLFVVGVPLVLWYWHEHLRCSLAAVRSAWVGGALAAGGALLMIAAMWRLWRDGGGLPMNAYPPPRVVTHGVYGLVPHPIYAGFIACCGGLALIANSAAALWIITPLAALGCVAIVLGYESPDLHRRFGDGLPAPWLWLPPGRGSLTPAARVGGMLAGILPWAVSYWAVKLLGVASDAFETRLGWEWSIPVLPASMPIYASIYLVVPITFLMAADRSEMRRLMVGAWAAALVNTLVYVTVPATAAFRTAQGQGWMHDWLAWEQGLALPASGSFPSFHVAWGVICAASLARGILHRGSLLVWLWCLGLGLSCLTTGMHSFADVVAGALVGFLCMNPARVWGGLIAATEWLGNSWKAWNIGPLRVMNHGLWSGLAGFAVLLIAGMAAGPGNLAWVFVVALSALLGAGLWAQWVEGSSALLRPFGYYGSVLGGLMAIAVMAMMNGPAAEMLGAFALAAPWTQAIGRLRCVVQGCCHGRPVGWGIRVTNPHSRVVKLAGFAGNPIHPTPLYSILANLVIGMLLMRMWIVGVAPMMVAGVNLVLSGLARFAEEAYRGEPQTWRFSGLPLYQWMALGSLVLGMVLMALTGGSQSPMHGPSAWLLLGAAAWGLICAFAMSMDFPKSNRRFSRLTG